MPIGSKYKHLLEDLDVRRWYENLEAKSVITATVYLRTLGLYCDLAKTSPKKILAEARSKRFRDGFTRLHLEDGEGGQGGLLRRTIQDEVDVPIFSYLPVPSYRIFVIPK